MERELWPLLYRELRVCALDFHTKYVQFHPWVLIAVYLWAALHDRPICWACDRLNWHGTTLTPGRLPSPSTMSRRAYSVAVGMLWHTLELRLRQASGDHPALISFLDGKPLPVGGYTTDTDASYGHGAGMNAKGYKLHTIWSNRALPEEWELTTLKTGETTVAGEMLNRILPEQGLGGYLLGDGNYDANPVFDHAFTAGFQLVVPNGKPNAGKGHHYQSPHRLRSIELMQSPRQVPSKSGFGRDLYKQRTSIERNFGNATSFGGGLGPLPAWVRTLHRVRIWVWAKLIVNAVRILRRKGLTAALQ